MDEDVEGDGDGDDGEDGDAKAEYVKKEYFARPWVSNTGMLEEVQDSIVRNSRPLMQMRITKKRKDFGSDTAPFMEKDANDSCIDLKAPVKNIMYVTSKKTLDIGLQAAY